MTILSIIISLCILVLVITIITRPLYSTKYDEPKLAVKQAADFRAEYQNSLNLIRELEQELLDGKIDQFDYKTNRERLNQEAAQILENLYRAENNQEK